MDLLEQLFAFYTKRYEKGPEFESKFNSACADLITAGDIKMANYIRFCVGNDIEPLVEPKTTIKRKAKAKPNDRSGGYGGRSGC